MPLLESAKALAGAASYLLNLDEKRRSSTADLLEKIGVCLREISDSLQRKPFEPSTLGQRCRELSIYLSEIDPILSSALGMACPLSLE
jgi:hypothetical protein